jgi:hypothetical protein
MRCLLLSCCVLLAGCPAPDDPLYLSQIFASRQSNGLVSVTAIVVCQSGVEGPGCRDDGIPCVEGTWITGPERDADGGGMIVVDSVKACASKPADHAGPLSIAFSSGVLVPEGLLLDVRLLTPTNLIASRTINSP